MDFEIKFEIMRNHWKREKSFQNHNFFIVLSFEKFCEEMVKVCNNGRNLVHRNMSWVKTEMSCLLFSSLISSQVNKVKTESTVIVGPNGEREREGERERGRGRGRGRGRESRMFSYYLLSFLSVSKYWNHWLFAVRVEKSNEKIKGRESWREREKARPEMTESLHNYCLRRAKLINSMLNKLHETRGQTSTTAYKSWPKHNANYQMYEWFLLFYYQLEELPHL